MLRPKEENLQPLGRVETRDGPVQLVEGVCAVAIQDVARSRNEVVNQGLASVETASKSLELNPEERNGLMGAIAQTQEAISNTAGQAIKRIEGINESHELSSCLSDPKTLGSVNLENLRAQAEFLREANKRFKDGFKEVDSAKSKQDKAKIAAELIEKDGFKPENLTAEQLALVFCTFKDASEFERMVDLYGKCNSEIFKNSPIIREFLAVGLHKAGEKKLKKEGNYAEADKRFEESGKVVKSLIDEGHGNGEVYAILGKISKLKIDYNKKLAGDENIPAEERERAAKEAEKALDESIEYLEKGFQNGFEFYPGINLTYNKITRGHDNRNLDEVREAVNVAELVYVSAQKAGGINSNDFWTLATMLESSVITGNKDENILQKVMQRTEAGWEIDAPIQNLQKLKEQLSNFQNTDEFKAVVENINWVLEKLKEKASEISSDVSGKGEGAKKEVGKSSEEAKATEMIFAKGFSYGEISSFAGGNIRYGGQLHDHVVNRWDIGVARGILNNSEIGQITNFDEFNQKIDSLVRGRYGTEPLEDLQSQEHKDFDAFMKGLNSELGVDKSADSRTNVMVDFFLGKGDCRQHAYTKQLFFDVWKTSLINQRMEAAYASLKSGDQEDFEAKTAEAKRWINMQMMVFDSVISSPIQMTEKYNPKKVDGELVQSKDGEFQEVEDHTWNGIVEVDGSGVITRFRMVDSFYQDEYKFGGNARKGGKLSAGVEIDYTQILGKGFLGGYQEAVNPKTGKKEKVEVRLTPTVYAANREKRMLPTKDDLGRPKLRGLILENFPNGSVDGFFDNDTTVSMASFAENIIDNATIDKKALTGV